MNMLSTWDEVDEGGYVIYGSPFTVRDRMKECIKEARCGIINCIFQIGITGTSQLTCDPDDPLREGFLL